MNNVVKNSAVIAAFVLLESAAFAQTPPPPPVPAHQGLFSKLFHPKPKPGIYQSNGSAMHPMSGQPGIMPGHSLRGIHSMSQGGSSVLSGQIIGNKNSHVYHLPGDKGSLPSPQNRVYFASAAAAEAAGYHAAGSSHKSMRAMTHGSAMQH